MDQVILLGVWITMDKGWQGQLIDGWTSTRLWYN